MYILDVVPIVKIPKGVSQVLSYFSSSSVKTGAVVSVPLGRAKVNAIVLASYSLDEEKISIKKSGFQIKNIEKIISEEAVISSIQLNLLKWFLSFNAAPVGLSAKTFVPSYLTKRKTSINIEDLEIKNEERKFKPRDLLIFGKDRDSLYEKEIERALIKNKQVLFLVPDVFLLEYYKKRFEKLNPVVLSSQVSPKKYFDAWKSIRINESQFVISTRSGVFLNFANLGLVVLEKEEDSNYKSGDMTPYYHTKDVASKLAELFSAKIIFGSFTPSIETYFKAKMKKIDLVKTDNLDAMTPMLVDMRNEIHGGNYSILSYQLQQKLQDIIENDKNAVLFLSRRGSETFVFCRDCGYVEKCPNCDASLINHKGLRAGLICHYCGFKKENQLKCPKCKSHRIKYFGAGTQKAKEEILKLWPDAKVGVLDSDATKTEKEQRAIFEDFKNKKINILIGTQLLFKKYNLPKIDFVAVLSMDNLLYLPDFRSGERIFQIARNTSMFCGNDFDFSDFILQTYTPENPVLEVIKKMDYQDFYKQEIKSREMFSYPPFSTIIKLIYKNKDKFIAEKQSVALFEKIANLNLKDIQLMGPAPAYKPKIRNNYIWQIIIKIKETENSNDSKATILKRIPEGWTIDVNPETLI